MEVCNAVLSDSPDALRCHACNLVLGPADPCRHPIQCGHVLFWKLLVYALFACAPACAAFLGAKCRRPRYHLTAKTIAGFTHIIPAEGNQGRCEIKGGARVQLGKFNVGAMGKNARAFPRRLVVAQLKPKQKCAQVVSLRSETYGTDYIGITLGGALNAAEV